MASTVCNPKTQMSKNILSVSYDASLLATRRMLLEQRGFKVTSALGYTQAIAHCNSPEFDLFILGHSIPLADKLELIRTFRQNCAAPILSLERHGEERVAGDFHASPDEPEEFLATVEKIFALDDSPKVAAGQSGPRDRAR
jgi:DNA-binding response OmpR family regulator